MRKFISFTIACLFISSMFFFYGNVNASTVNDPSLSNEEIARKTINQYIDSIDKHDWNAFISLQLDAYQNDLKEFISYNEKNNKSDGVLAINSAKIKEINLLPNDALAEIIDINSYVAKYVDIYAYLVGINYNVKKQSKYYLNGINYRIIITGQENEKSKILFEMEAPLEILESKGYGFNSSDENAALKVRLKRYNGEIIDLNGNY